MNLKIRDPGGIRKEEREGVSLKYIKCIIQIYEILKTEKYVLKDSLILKIQMYPSRCTEAQTCPSLQCRAILENTEGKR